MGSKSINKSGQVCGRRDVDILALARGENSCDRESNHLSRSGSTTRTLHNDHHDPPSAALLQDYTLDMSESALVEFLKPRHAEAVTQMRNSLAALLLLVVLTSLLPLPALPMALYKYISARYTSSFERAAVWTGAWAYMVP